MGGGALSITDRQGRPAPIQHAADGRLRRKMVLVRTVVLLVISNVFHARKRRKDEGGGRNTDKR
jgi:hypothetical protein